MQVRLQPFDPIRRCCNGRTARYRLTFTSSLGENASSISAQRPSDHNFLFVPRRSHSRQAVSSPAGEFASSVDASRPQFIAELRIMRRTGKLYTLTLVSVLMTVVASLLVVQWRDASATWHLWLDIVPQGFGMASLITSTLIVSIYGVFSARRIANREFAGHDRRRHQRGCGRGHWQ